MKYISYSQFNQFLNCKKQYELSYIHKLSIHKPSINTVIGTSVHETIQYYFDNNKNNFDYSTYLMDRLQTNVKKDKEQFEEKFTTSEELLKYYNNSINVLKIFFNNTYIHNDYNYVANEFEIREPLSILFSDNNIFNNIGIVSYLDLLFKDKDGNYYIYDIKTSNKQWTKEQKNDIHKLSQLFLYKKLLSKILNIDETKIKIIYIILSLEDSNIEIYEPNIPIDNNILYDLKDFILSVFEENGDYKNIQFNQTSDENNCVWCEYKGTPYCNKFKLSI